MSNYKPLANVLASPKRKLPRAYYIGAFGVGGGVPRVAVLEQIAYDRYRVRVTSRNAYAYKLGEEFEAAGRDLYDKTWSIQGPGLAFRGQSWRAPFDPAQFPRPAFLLRR